MVWAGAQRKKIQPANPSSDCSSLARHIYLASPRAQNTKQHNGLEAWRRRKEEYEPASKGQQRVRLQQLMRPGKPASVLRLYLPWRGGRKSSWPTSVFSRKVSTRTSRLEFLVDGSSEGR
eukprot:3579882-Amphidinium_carterae.1